VAEQGSTPNHPAGAGVATAATWTVEGDPTEEEMIGTGEAAAIIGKDARTIERWVDRKKLRGGRPADPLTGEPVENSHRWVDVRHAVALAVGGGRAHLVPEKWRYLIPQTFLPSPRSGDNR
jgi:hypothetical protein